MKKILYNSSSKQAFTLVEILVSLTILSIIMVSVMVVFVNSTQLSAKSDINRIMQENVKNLISNIGEDIRKNSIS
jgi:prepilin-type N-terminal cleavage/methylation domain-containing protein